MGIDEFLTERLRKTGFNDPRLTKAENKLFEKVRDTCDFLFITDLSTAEIADWAEVEEDFVLAIKKELIRQHFLSTQ